MYKSLKRLFYFKSSLKNIIKKTQHLINYLQINKKKFIHIKKKVDTKNDNKSTNIDNIFSTLKINNIILKIDIESYEYKIIQNILKYKDLIKMFII